MLQIDIDTGSKGFCFYTFLIKKNERTNKVIDDIKADFGKVKSFVIKHNDNSGIDFDGDWIEV